MSFSNAAVAECKDEDFAKPVSSAVVGGSPPPPSRLFELVRSAQEHEDNKKRLDDEFGGTLQLAANLGTDLVAGFKSERVPEMRTLYGANRFPEAPMKGFCILFFEAFNDTILIVLIAAAIVSIVVGSIEDPSHGYIEGCAILIAVLIVAAVTAGNDYSKELQFRALEKTSEDAERCIVLRDAITKEVPPEDLVVGDIVVLKVGDGIPADGILFAGDGCKSNESGLTGEPDDLEKRPDGDPFLFSSCTITELGRSADCRMLVNAVGEHSQWGKIKADLVKPPSETPLQQKLDVMVKLIGYIGVGFALATFTVLVVSIWVRDGGQNVTSSIINAFLISVTIVVVAIPEGLPLAVTISLAYSTRRMYKDMNLIRVLQACETMGNATNICSDKTGTLTENQMTVVEGWFCDKVLTRDTIRSPGPMASQALDVITQHIAVNRSVDVKFIDNDGEALHKPKVIGNATEGSLVLLITDWGYNAVAMKKALFDPAVDLEYPFDSKKKRSSTLIRRKDADGQYRLFMKGASEDILALCQHYSTQDGTSKIMTPEIRKQLEDTIYEMANRALRTLCIAHRDYASEKDLPSNYKEAGPAPTDLVVDAIVGIMDPLRGDVKEAVATAQRAGVTVRMVTGDNIDTARAIARECGIYDADHGVAMTGPDFRNLTPAQLDEVLPRLQVLARSTPKDKFLLVTRLNGNGLPKDEKEWLEYHDKDGTKNLSWERDRDRLLPGYIAEWNVTRKRGGEVVGVTSDGTNDAPALKAADVGLSMGITGTKVAQNASDIVILDDRFSSIVRAIMWGRAVYDNIRKFLQFQLTVNVVALLLVFIGSAAGFDPPLNAVMMLWVNLIMDTLGALALGTEAPTPSLLERRPYGRQARLVSRPMVRNILVQAIFQMAVLLFLLFGSETIFVGVGPHNPCKKWEPKGSSTQTWDLDGNKASGGTGPISCSTFVDGYGAVTSAADYVAACYPSADNRVCVDNNYDQFNGFEDTCLNCAKLDFTHYAIIFNAFVFCQIFNEINARSIFNEWNVFKGMTSNMTFIGVILVTLGLQVAMVEVGGAFVQTAHLTPYQWLVTIGLGAVSLPLGVLMRFIPAKEDPNDFAGAEYNRPHSGAAVAGDQHA